MKKTLFFIVLIIISGLGFAQTGEELLLMVDSAYAEALEGRLQEAIKINEDGLALVPPDSVGLQCEFYSCLLFCYHRLGDYEQALHYGELCLSYDEVQGDPSDISASLGNLAGIYSSVGKHDVAISYLNRAIRIEEELIATDPEHTEKSLAIRKAMLGEVLLAKAMTLPEEEREPLFVQALQLTKEAYLIDMKLDRQAQVGMRLSQLGNIYLQMGDEEQARECSRQALEIARQTNNRATEVITLLQLGQYEEAAQLAQTIGMKKQEMEACRRLMEAYKKAGRYEDALAMSERASALSEAMLNEETERQLTLWQVRYDTQQKEQQLKLQEQTIRQQRVNSRWLIVLVALTLVAVALLMLYARLLKRRKRDVEEQAREKDRLYSVLTHDLKNPMVAQQLVLQVLYSKFENAAKEEVYVDLGRLLASNGAQLEMVSNLQEMTLLELGKRTFHPIRIDLAGVIKEVAGNMKDIAALKGITIVPQTQRTLAMADREVVRVVVRNLLSNAIKFSNEGSVIEVGTMEPNALFVRDSGVGMTAKKVAELLEAKTQMSSVAGTRGEGGSGMGMLLCRELLQLNHGTMSIQSEPNKGTIITITFPTPNS